MCIHIFKFWTSYFSKLTQLNKLQKVKLGWKLTIRKTACLLQPSMKKLYPSMHWSFKLLVYLPRNKKNMISIKFEHLIFLGKTQCSRSETIQFEKLKVLMVESDLKEIHWEDLSAYAQHDKNMTSCLLNKQSCLEWDNITKRCADTHNGAPRCRFWHRRRGTLQQKRRV